MNIVCFQSLTCYMLQVEIGMQRYDYTNMHIVRGQLTSRLYEWMDAWMNR